MEKIRYLKLIEKCLKRMQKDTQKLFWIKKNFKIERSTSPLTRAYFDILTELLVNEEYRQF